MKQYYSTPEEVIHYTGVKPVDFGLEEQAELITLIETWLLQVKDLIDRDRNRNYLSEVEVPAGIENIAMRMAANMVALANLRRETPVVKHDDFNIKMVEDKIFTNGIKEDLSRYPAKARFRITRVKGWREYE